MVRLKVKSSEVRTDFAEIVNHIRFQKAHVVVTTYGEPSVVMVSIDEYRRLTGSYNKVQPESTGT